MLLFLQRWFKPQRLFQELNCSNQAYLNQFKHSSEHLILIPLRLVIHKTLIKIRVTASCVDWLTVLWSCFLGAWKTVIVLSVCLSEAGNNEWVKKNDSWIMKCWTEQTTHLANLSGRHQNKAKTPTQSSTSYNFKLVYQLEGSPSEEQDSKNKINGGQEFSNRSLGTFFRYDQRNGCDACDERSLYLIIWAGCVHLTWYIIMNRCYSLYGDTKYRPRIMWETSQGKKDRCKLYKP